MSSRYTSSPHINDQDIMERIRLVEGERYCRDLTEPVDVYTSRPAGQVWAEWLIKNGDHAGPNDSTQIVIYGEGGWTRYYVRGDGSVVFSERHSAPKSLERAKAAGFTIR